MTALSVGYDFSSTGSLIVGLNRRGDCLLVKLAEAQFFRGVQGGYVYAAVMLWVVEGASWPTGDIR